MESPEAVDRRHRHAARREIESLPTQHACGAEQETEKKEGKLFHAQVAIQDFTPSAYDNEYLKRVTTIRDLEVLAMRVRNSYLSGVRRLPGIQLARPVVPADLLNRKCPIAGAALHFLYLRSMELD